MSISYKKSFICSCLFCHRRKSGQDRQRCALPCFESGIGKTLERSEFVLPSMKSYWGGKAAPVRRYRFALQVSAPSLGGFVECSELREANGPRLLGFPGWSVARARLCSSCTQRVCRAAFSATRCSTTQKRISLLPTFRTCPVLLCSSSDSVGCPIW